MKHIHHGGLPQSESKITSRKDGIQSSLIGTFNVLATRCSYNVESIIKVDALIAMDFKRNLLICQRYCVMK